MAKASDNDFPSILTSELASKPTAPGANKQRLYFKTDHKLYHEDSGGTETEVGADSGRGISYVDRNNYTGGNFTLNSVTWADFQNALDLSITAQAGDVIMIGLSLAMSAENVEVYLDACTIVAAAPVTYFSSGSGTQAAYGIQAWDAAAAHYKQQGAPMILTLGAGDVSGGAVAIRLRYKSASAANRTAYAAADLPCTFWGINLSR